MMAFDTLVLSGGGTKGLGHLGFLHYYLENNLIDFDNIHTYAGTSIGSVICLLLLIGYKPMDIFSEIYKMKTYLSPGSIKNFGLFNLNLLFEKVEQMVTTKLGSVPTLAQLYDKTKKKLVVVTGNVSRPAMPREYFHYENRPNISCVDVLKLSCNLPLICEKLKYNNCYYVDGGLVDNFPIDYVNNGRNNILGLVVVGEKTNCDTEDSFPNYICGIINMPINANTTKYTSTVKNKCVIVRMDFDTAPLFDFAFASEKKMELFTQGYKYGKQHHAQEYLYVEGVCLENKFTLDIMLGLVSKLSFTELEHLEKLLATEIETRKKKLDGWENDWVVN
jgi:predicted acylesterase/phospholipase RssA